MILMMGQCGIEVLRHLNDWEPVLFMVMNNLLMVAMIYRVSFLTGTPLKVLSVRLHSKFHR